jgi:hypothetical protein
MPLEDKALRLRIMREIAKRNVDALRLQVSVLNNIVTLNGELRPLRGRLARNTKEELETIRQILLTIPKVREVIIQDVRCF